MCCKCSEINMTFWVNILSSIQICYIISQLKEVLDLLSPSGYHLISPIFLVSQNTQKNSIFPLSPLPLLYSLVRSFSLTLPTTTAWTWSSMWLYLMGISQLLCSLPLFPKPQHCIPGGFPPPGYHDATLCLFPLLAHGVCCLILSYSTRPLQVEAPHGGILGLLISSLYSLPS